MFNFIPYLKGNKELFQKNKKNFYSAHKEREGESGAAEQKRRPRGKQREKMKKRGAQQQKIHDGSAGHCQQHEQPCLTAAVFQAVHKSGKSRRKPENGVCGGGGGSRAKAAAGRTEHIVKQSYGGAEKHGPQRLHRLN